MSHARWWIGAARQAPLTAGLLALLWGIGLATGSISHGPSPKLLKVVGVGAGSLAAGHVWSPVTALLWCSGLASYLLTTALLLALCAPAERRLGVRRTAVAILITQVLGSFVTIMVVRLAAAAGEGWSGQLATQLTVGPATVAVGVALAGSGGLRALWRRRLRLLLLVGLVTLALYSGSLQDLLRLSAGLVGLALGAAVLARHRRRAAPVSSQAETRLLVAIVVAASALGPLVAVLSGTAIGPLSVLRFLFLSPPPDPLTVREVCLDPQMFDDCLALRGRLRLSGAGPALMSVMPVLLMLGAAEGLRRGRRFAWWVALALNGVLTVLGTLLALAATGTPRQQLVAFEGLDESRYLLVAILPLAQPLLVVVLLLAVRHRFDVQTPRWAYRRLTMNVAVALSAVFVLYVAGGFLTRRQFDRPPTLLALLVDLPLRLLPPGYLGEVDVSFLPARPIATTLYEWSGPLFWLCVIIASFVTLLATRPHRGNTDAAPVRTLLEAGSAGPLSYMATWAGNNYWLDANGHTAIAYRVIGRVALTTGDPIGPTSTHRQALHDFGVFCFRNSWTPCLYSITEATAVLATQLGWHTLQVAEEATVPLHGLTFTGRKWQDIRTALNHAARNEINAQWVSYPQAPPPIAAQIRSISNEWVVDKGVPEMGFTLGGLAELADNRVRCLLAVDADHHVHAITSWLPVYRDGATIGWTLDLIRRRRDAFRGVTEFLIASAIIQFQREGAEFASLSGAPLARLDRHAAAPAMQRVVDSLGRILEPICGFRSLLAFKSKFQPVYHPLFMAYPDPAALPVIATSIGRAYLPNLTPQQGSRLLGRLLR